MTPKQLVGVICSDEDKWHDLFSQLQSAPLYTDKLLQVLMQHQDEIKFEKMTDKTIVKSGNFLKIMKFLDHWIEYCRAVNDLLMMQKLTDYRDHLTGQYKIVQEKNIKALQQTLPMIEQSHLKPLKTLLQKHEGRIGETRILSENEWREQIDNIIIAETEARLVGLDGKANISKIFEHFAQKNNITVRYKIDYDRAMDSQRVINDIQDLEDNEVIFIRQSDSYHWDIYLKINGKIINAINYGPTGGGFVVRKALFDQAYQDQGADGRSDLPQKDSMSCLAFCLEYAKTLLGNQGAGIANSLITEIDGRKIFIPCAEVLKYAQSDSYVEQVARRVKKLDEKIAGVAEFKQKFFKAYKEIVEPYRRYMHKQSALVEMCRLFDADQEESSDNLGYAHEKFDQANHRRISYNSANDARIIDYQKKTTYIGSIARFTKNTMNGDGVLKKNNQRIVIAGQWKDDALITGVVKVMIADQQIIEYSINHQGISNCHFSKAAANQGAPSIDGQYIKIPLPGDETNVRSMLFDSNKHQFIIDYANQNTYVGDWYNGHPTGNGLMEFANGDKFQGKWINGKPNEYGEYYNQADKIKLCGIWDNGILIDGTVTLLEHNETYPLKVAIDAKIALSEDRMVMDGDITYIDQHYEKKILSKSPLDELENTNDDNTQTDDKWRQEYIRLQGNYANTGSVCGARNVYQDKYTQQVMTRILKTNCLQLESLQNLRDFIISDQSSAQTLVKNAALTAINYNLMCKQLAQAKRDIHCDYVSLIEDLEGSIGRQYENNNYALNDEIRQKMARLLTHYISHNYQDQQKLHDVCSHLKANTATKDSVIDYCIKELQKSNSIIVREAYQTTLMAIQRLAQSKIFLK